MKIGIGTEWHRDALAKAGCEKVFSVSEIEKYAAAGIDVDLIFRPGDTAVVVKPSYVPIKLMRAVNAVGVEWQVPGHEPMTLKSEEARSAWRKQRPRGDVADVVPVEQVGRRPVYPVPTAEQLAALLTDWHSPMKLMVVQQRMRTRMGFAPEDEKGLPKHWIRDQVIKACGSAKRNKT